MKFFPSLEHFQTILELLTDLISIFLCLSLYGEPEERKWGGRMAGWWSSHITHSIYQLSLGSYMGMFLWCPQIIAIVTLKIIDHQNKQNNE